MGDIGAGLDENEVENQMLLTMLRDYFVRMGFEQLKVKLSSETSVDIFSEEDRRILVELLTTLFPERNKGVVNDTRFASFTSLLATPGYFTKEMVMNAPITKHGSETNGHTLIQLQLNRRVIVGAVVQAKEACNEARTRIEAMAGQMAGQLENRKARNDKWIKIEEILRLMYRFDDLMSRGSVSCLGNQVLKGWVLPVTEGAVKEETREAISKAAVTAPEVAEAAAEAVLLAEEIKEKASKIVESSPDL